ncbi:hypothetical protein R1sor_027043 [Riccia sorocarpa]|uniref:Uncharacterized protein n=1 Tax=Riccia sorocarpa TaxID=122646 RepID=A0ABD3GGE4_9MARC
MGSQSRRQRTIDRKRTDQLGQSSRPIAQANEDRLRLRRQRYAEEQAESTTTSNSEHVASGSQRGIRRKVLEMVDKLKSLSDESIEYESKNLTHFLKHSSISKSLKVGEIMSWKEQRAAKLLLANLATSLKTIKGTHTQDDVIAKKCVLRMCSSKHIIDNRLDRQSSRCLKIAPRNIRIHANGRATILDENNTQIGKWAGVKPGRAQRSDILSVELREVVLNWWTEETRVSPIAKRVLKRQNHAIHTLDMTQTEFYELFMLSHDVMKVGGVWIPTRISQSMFCKLKPRWVKKEKDRNICCCRYHVELVNCKNMLNTLRKDHHGHGTRPRSCACLDVNCLPCRGGGSSETDRAQGVTEATVEAEAMNCAAINNLVQRLRDLMSLFVCPVIHVPVEGSETKYWFRKAYINLNCAQYGTRKFESALCGVYEVADPVNLDTIKWERYEYVGQGLKDEHGREKRRLELVFVETPVSTFIQFMKDKLAHL